MTRRRALIVDDEPQIRTIEKAYLEAAGFEVVEADSAARTLIAFDADMPFDVVLLDVGLPDGNGIDVLRQLRTHSDVFVLLVTARADEVDKLVGLGVGADDYITKPFSPRELVARVETVLRRRTPAQPVISHDDDIVRFDALTLDRGRREVTVGLAPVPLSALDFDLLWALASAPGRVFSRAQLLEKVWGYDFYGDDRVVDVHIRSMRRALGDDANDPTIIATVRGVGYKLIARPVAESKRHQQQER